MTSSNFLGSLRRQLVSPQGAIALLGLLSTRRRGRRSNGSSVGWVVGGLVIGAGAALLFGTSRGQTLRSRLGGSIGSGIGDVVGGVVGAHPIKTAKLVETVKDTFAPKGT